MSWHPRKENIKTTTLLLMDTQDEEKSVFIVDLRIERAKT